MSYKRGSQKLKRRKRTSSKKEFDENKEINVAVKTGKVIIGTKKLVTQLATGEEPLKLIILAKNAPKKVKEPITLLNNSLEEPIPVHISKNSSWDLGAVCGKPFWISALGIMDEGDSSILKVIELNKEKAVSE